MCKLAHSSAYVDGMFEKLTEKEEKEASDTLSFASLEHVEGESGDTRSSKGTKQAIMSSVFAVQVAVDKIVKGEYANIFVVQRPPGHHLGDEGRALGASSQGFCYMNGAAIAAQYYLQKHPGARVTIIDCELRPAARPPTHHPRLSRLCLRDSRPAPRERHARVRAEESQHPVRRLPQKDVAGHGVDERRAPQRHQRRVRPGLHLRRRHGQVG